MHIGLYRGDGGQSPAGGGVGGGPGSVVLRGELAVRAVHWVRVGGVGVQVQALTQRRRRRRCHLLAVPERLWGGRGRR